MLYGGGGGGYNQSSTVARMWVIVLIAFEGNFQKFFNIEHECNIDLSVKSLLSERNYFSFFINISIFEILWIVPEAQKFNS